MTGGMLIPGLPAPALPEKSTIFHGTETSTSTPTAQGAIAMGGLTTAREAGHDALQDQLANAREVAGVEAQGAQDLVDLQRRQQEERARREAEQREQVAQRVAQAAQARKAMEMRAGEAGRDLWDDKGTPFRILGALLVGLSQGAYQRAGGQGMGPVYQMFEKERALDRQRKLDAFQASKDFHDLAQNDVTAAHRALADELARIDNQHLAAANILKAEVAALAKKKGLPGVFAAGQKELAAFDADAFQKEAQLQEHFKTTTRRETPTVTINENKAANAPKPSEGEEKLALYSSQMKRDLDIIRENPALSAKTLDKVQAQELGASAADKAAGEGVGGAFSVGLGRKLGVIPRTKYEGLKPGEQKVVNAWDSVVENFVRMKTGAGMPEQEARTAALRNAPTAGDSKEVVAQKFKRLEDAANEMQAISGPAAQRLQAAQPAAPAPTPAPSRKPAKFAPVEKKTIGKTTYVRINGDWWVQ